MQYEFGKCFELGKFEMKSNILLTPFFKTENNLCEMYVGLTP